MRQQLLKRIIMKHLAEHKALIRNACQNETECFVSYMRQLKSQYEKLPTAQLEAIARAS